MLELPITTAPAHPEATYVAVALAIAGGAAALLYALAKAVPRLVRFLTKERPRETEPSRPPPMQVIHAPRTSLLRDELREEDRLATRVERLEQRMEVVVKNEGRIAMLEAWRLDALQALTCVEEVRLEQVKTTERVQALVDGQRRGRVRSARMARAIEKVGKDVARLLERTKDR